MYLTYVLCTSTVSMCRYLVLVYTMSLLTEISFSVCVYEVTFSLWREQSTVQVLYILQDTLLCVRFAGAVRGAIEPLLSYKANGDVPRRRGRPRSPRSSSPVSQTQSQSRGARRQQHSPESNSSAGSSSSADSLAASPVSNGTGTGTGNTHSPTRRTAEQRAEELSDAGGSARKGRLAAVVRKAQEALNSHGGGFALLFFIFACYLLALGGVYLVFPEMRRYAGDGAIICTVQYSTVNYFRLEI